MKGYIALMLGSAILLLTISCIIRLEGRQLFAEKQLENQIALTAEYKQKFEDCKRQLGVFYRDPCCNSKPRSK